MTRHQLKIWPEYFRRLITGEKTFERRQDDRGFHVGDILLLQEWCPQRGRYTGRQCQALVTYMEQGGQFGLAPGYVVMSIAIASPPPDDPDTTSRASHYS